MYGHWAALLASSWGEVSDPVGCVFYFGQVNALSDIERCWISLLWWPCRFRWTLEPQRGELDSQGRLGLPQRVVWRLRTLYCVTIYLRVNSGHTSWEKKVCIWHCILECYAPVSSLLVLTPFGRQQLCELCTMISATRTSVLTLLQTISAFLCA